MFQINPTLRPYIGLRTQSTALYGCIHPVKLCLCCRVLAAQEASVRGQLHMNTFRRLNLALVLQTGTTLVVAAQAVSLRNHLLTGGCRNPTIISHSIILWILYNTSVWLVHSPLEPPAHMWVTFEPIMLGFTSWHSRCSQGAWRATQLVQAVLACVAECPMPQLLQLQHHAHLAQQGSARHAASSCRAHCCCCLFPCWHRLHGAGVRTWPAAGITHVYPLQAGQLALSLHQEDFGSCHRGAAASQPTCSCLLPDHTGLCWHGGYVPQCYTWGGYEVLSRLAW